MDDELKTKLVSYLGKLEAAAGKAEDFAAVEVPETIKEWLRWQLIDGCTTAAVLLFVGILFPVLLYRINRCLAPYIDDKEDRGGLAVVLFALSLISAVPLYWSFQSAKYVAKVYLAPRVVIVEKVAELAKQHK